MVKLFVWVAEVKNYFGFSQHYLGIANFLLLVAVATRTYNLPFSPLLIVPLATGGVLLLGYLDYKFVAAHQMAHSNKVNDLKAQLDRIEAKLQ